MPEAEVNGSDAVNRWEGTYLLYDVFICHASEDKDAVARPLAEFLKSNHVEVWYDEFSLKPGDSLRSAIDLGLSRCRYGVVILSYSFFERQWPKWELAALVQRQNASATKVILPVWHRVSHADVLNVSPSLADLVAVTTDQGVERTGQQLLDVLRPEGSTLFIARDLLLDYGYDPPVVTDDWWLDVVAFAYSNSVEDTFQEPMGWGRWGFPLPPDSRSPRERGTRLAWAAMQRGWQAEADRRQITQLTDPADVHAFISKTSGLKEACAANLPYLLAYAPQVAIPGCGGEFEDEIDEMLEYDLTQRSEGSAKGSRSGAGLTVDGNVPVCGELLALRHPTFGNYQPSTIACHFVQGDLMGPDVKVFDHVDYLAWLLSAEGDWMPKNVRDFLIVGMKEWAVWASDVDVLFPSLDRKDGGLSDNERSMLERRLDNSCRILAIPESGKALADRLLAGGFIEAVRHTEAERLKRNSGKRSR